MKSLPIETKYTAVEYQEPEVYGNSSKEEFDPIVADVWSMGGIFYYMFTGTPPYDNTVLRITDNIKDNQKLSDEGKKLLAQMLKPMAVESKHIDKLTNDLYFKKFK